MDKIDKDHELSKSKDLTEENINKLKELFPEIVTDGKVDFKVLQEVLGEELEEEEEYYRFTWAGKTNARREAHKPSTGTLRPNKEESKNWDTTENLYIEGDNLEVLKLIQKSYSGRIKMIYIDPPYNTGKDFVYKDNYHDNLKNYQQLTGQVDAEGNQISTNTDSDGRFHSNWLNMMYPRLKLARNLLTDDGVIFISVDDSEIANLKKITSEVFGEINFIATIVWERSFSPVNLKKHFSESHDYVICYAKNIDNLNSNGIRRKVNDSRYKNPDNDFRGPWTSADMTVGPPIEEKLYKVKIPSGKTISPPSGRCWVFTKDKFDEMRKDNRIWFGANGNNVPRVKKFLSEVKEGITPMTVWSHEEVGHSQDAAQKLKSLFEGSDFFDYPKSIGLITRMLELYTVKNSIVLDFFSGSASTAHAVMQLNAEDGGNRKHIQVQLPEPTDAKSEAHKAGYKSIADIGKERIRRAGEKILNNIHYQIVEREEKIEAIKKKKVMFQSEDVESLGKEIEEIKKKKEKLDIGFKVFKLDSSNIKAWDGSIENLESSLFEAEENIKAKRTEEDILYEVLLKYGLDLTLPIEEREIEREQVFNVGRGALFLCLGNNISSKVAEGIGQWKEELQPEICRAIFKDNGFNDVEKTNAIQVLKRYGINEVKSI